MTDLALQEYSIAYIHKLSDTQKDIYKLLQWHFGKFQTVFPSHERIANYVRCCRKTVIRAMKRFLELGLIGWVNRANQSNVYFIPDVLKGVDLAKVDLTPPKEEQTKDPECIVFPRECPTDVPRVISNKDNNSSYRSIDAKTEPFWKVAKRRQVPEMLNIPALLPHQRQKIANDFCDDIIRSALQSTSQYLRKDKGNSIHNLGAFLWKACKNASCYISKRFGKIDRPQDIPKKGFYMSVTKRDFDGREYTCSKDDYYAYVARTKKPWSVEQIEEGWKEFVDHRFSSPDWMAVLDGLIQHRSLYPRDNA